MLIANVDIREREETREYTDMLKIAGQTPAQIAKIQNDIKMVVEKAKTDRLKIYDDERQVLQQNWNTVLTSVQSAWDSQLKGLLSGTTTWAQAMKNIVADMVQQIIKEFEKAALAKAAAGLATAGLDVGTGGIGGALFNLISKPFGFAEGGIVPQDMIAMVHAGETILPPGVTPAAQMFGGTTHNNSLSIDSLNVTNSGGGPMNPMDIARAVAQVWNQNPGLRPTY
jgi:hypothetical protein